MKPLRIAAVGDLHCHETSIGVFRPHFEHLGGKADLLVLAGDLTETGLVAEVNVLLHELSAIDIPILAVLGNHDYEAGQQKEITKALIDRGIIVLDGSSFILDDTTGFVGVKGFCGGFGSSALQPWGETVLKNFVQEAVGEALKLESALSHLETDRKIVVMHYAPIRDTLVGEPPEIVPFLGSSRMSTPVDSFGATLVIHGHAHHGAPEARTSSGVPVYNVALAVLRHHYPGTYYRILEV